jgi:uncharacterized protein
MVALCITSLIENAGKTMVSAGLGQHWLNCGKKVEYFRMPASNLHNQSSAEKDTAFMRKLPGINQATAVNIQNKTGEEVIKAYQAASPNNDVIILEGLLKEISSFPDTFKFKILIIHDYSTPLSASLAEYKKLGSRLLGVVVNKIPRKDISRMQSRLIGELAQSGLRCFGLVPENRILMALSIADLAEAVQGQILNNSEKSGELVENFMMGNSTFDKTAIYERKDNKAVLLWGERPGFRKAALSNWQLGALQTSTRCIVISANGTPVPAVAQKADEQQVPLISAPGSIPDLVVAIEKAFSNLKFNQEKKLPQLTEILQSSFNFEQLEEGLGGGCVQL